MDLHHTAIHEAGHFLVAHTYEWINQDTVVSVMPDESSLGRVAQTKNPLKGQSNYEQPPPEHVRNAGDQAMDEWFQKEEMRTTWAREQALKCAVLCMGGAEACRVAGLPDPDEGADDDLRNAFDALNHFPDAVGEPQEGDALVEAMLNVACVRARGIVGYYHQFRVLEAVAEELKDNKTLTGEQAANVLQETMSN